MPGGSLNHTSASQMCLEYQAPQEVTILANSVQLDCWICASSPLKMTAAQEGLSPLDALGIFNDRKEHKDCKIQGEFQLFGKQA